MIDQEKLHSFLRAMSAGRNAEDLHRALSKFMCHCLNFVQPKFPAIGQQAMNVACRCWLLDEFDAESLNSERVACWGYLDSMADSADLSDSEDVAIRALVCVLYPEPDGEDFSVESVLWFVSMLDRLGDYAEEVEQLMRSQLLSTRGA